MKPISCEVQPNQATVGLLDEYLAGLRRRPKRLPSKFFYDEEGSRLFEQICGLDEYYPTRTECAILGTHVDEIVERVGERATIVELGSGDGVKVRILLNHLREPAAYVPVDISREQLNRSCEELRSEYAGLPVFPVCADYTHALGLPEISGESRSTLLFFPGSTFGNLEPIEALGFLLRLARRQGSGTGLLIGIDLKKEESVLKAAYNDSSGVTAAFNRNILARANRDFGANFEVDQFDHCVHYDSAHGRIVMELESLRRQEVQVAGERISFERGERITTEYSYKYRIPEFRALAGLAGFTHRAVWTDPDELFSLHYLEVA